MSKEDLWKKAVEDARNVISSKTFSQMKVAELALSVCEISWGGGKKEVYTLTKFSSLIGISPKTLSNWCAAKRNVYDKIPEYLKSKVSTTDILMVAKNVSRETPREHVVKLMTAYISEDNYDHKMRRYICDMRAIAHNFEDRQAVFKCKEDTLSEILFYLDLIKGNIKNFKPKIKAKDNNVALTRSPFASLARALDIPRTVRLRMKDEKILDYLRKKKKFISPTTVGLELSNHSKSSSSAWAGRTMHKLLKIGLVERNDVGHYKAK